MSRSALRAIVIGGVIAAAALSQNAAAVAAGDQVPFKAMFSGSAVLTSPWTIVFDGSGQASHLGRMANVGDVLVTGLDGSCPGGVTAVNTETLTAANGDSITVTSHDVTCLTGPMQYHGTGLWTVTGGTGRFGGAAGSGTFDGIADLAAQTFTISLEGTISTPGALK